MRSSLGIVASSRVRGAGAYAAAVMSDGPIAYWRMEETSGTNVVDHVGSYNGTITGGTLGVSGAVGKGFTFDGVDDHLAGTTLGSFGSNIGTLGFTFEFWIKTTTTARKVIFGFFNDGFNTGIQVVTNTNAAGSALLSNSTHFQIRQEGANQSLGAFSSAAVYDGAWHHVVLVRPSGSAPIHVAYVDGVAVTTTMHTNQSGSSFANLAYPLRIGARSNRATVDEFFAGSLDEFAVYSKALGSTAVIDHYYASLTPSANQLTTDASWTWFHQPTAIYLED